MDLATARAAAEAGARKLEMVQSDAQARQVGQY
jgi:hypothetical protein